MDEILELQSEIYIKLSRNEPYKFEKMEKTIQQYNENTITRAKYVKMMYH